MSKNKYYAIRKGRKDNIIVNTWNECEDLIKGYHGAEYKAFSDERDAKQYLGISEIEPLEVQQPLEEPERITTPVGFTQSRIITQDGVEGWKEEITIRIPKQTRKMVEEKSGMCIENWLNNRIAEFIKGA